jgi:transcriptional regulator with XRE-family HTH domain
VTATELAEAAGMSRMTLHRIEKGEPSVTMGAYMSVIAALGLRLELADPGVRKASRDKAPLPRAIRIADYPQLKRIAWQLADTELTPKEALALYQRNWRHVDRKAMDDLERDLVRRLAARLGGRLVV